MFDSGDNRPTDGYMPSSLRQPKAQVRRLAFAIGKEMGSGSFAMWEGPFDSEREALETVAEDASDCIIRYNPDGTDVILWRWNGHDQWLKQNE